MDSYLSDPAVSCSEDKRHSFKSFFVIRCKLCTVTERESEVPDIGLDTSE